MKSLAITASFMLGISAAALHTTSAAMSPRERVALTGDS